MHPPGVLHPATLAVMNSQQRSRARRTQRISGPAELVQAIPYLLGFHPQRSLVLVGLHGGQLVVTARVDLSDVHAGAVRHTLEAMARGGTTSVVAAVFDDDVVPAGELRYRPLVATVYGTAERVGCDVVDVLRVSGGRWWSLTCSDPDCCPSDGRDLPDAPSPFTAAAAYDGVVALPDRAALAALLDPLPPPDRGALDAAIEAAEHAAVQATLDAYAGRWQRSVKRAIFSAARASEEVDWQGTDDADVPRFGVALGVRAIRDAVWVAVDDGRIEGRPLWRDLARRLPSPYDAAPLFLFGWASWRSGDGTLAGIAAERAVASDPEYSPADLLLAAVAQGADPRHTPKVRLGRSA
jgi:hypothetical protein